MKKYSLPFIAITALALAGCAREQSLEEDGIKMVIEAVMAENNTKTIIQDGTTSVLWEAGDEIKVFFDGTGGRFANQYTEPSATARFSGTLNVVFASNEGFSDATPLWGLYPYRTDATADNASVTTTLPASQIGRADSFAKNTLITLGKSTSLSMGFYNVCGGIRFSLTQEGIKEVVFQGLNDENIAGKVRLAFEDGLPAVQEVIEGEKTITLTAPGNATFETGCWYYIVALPGTLSNGFRMTFNTATQYATLESSGSKTIKRGIFGSLANADEGLVFEDKEDSSVEDGNIVFADPAAKYACVTKFDTNGDGEVSIEEAEAATSFEGLFTNWRGVTSFDEIKYFKNVHSLSGAFNGCTKLISLTVPENITDIGEDEFAGCSSLTSIILPSGITRIGQRAFIDCSSLSSINIPSNVTAIDANAFYNCSSLESIDFPANLESIGDFAFSECSSLAIVDFPANLESIGYGAFEGCSSLTDIVIPDSVTSIGGSAFWGCSNLSSVHLPSGITSIPSRCFYQCSALTTVSIPDGVTSIGERAFEKLRMWKLELPSSISYLGGYCFGDNSNIICLLLPSTSPVTIEPGAFYGYGVQRIYVPSNLIDMYSVMTNWSYYASRLLPIDSYSDEDYSPYLDPGILPVEGTSEWSIIGSLSLFDRTEFVAAKDGDIYVVKNVRLTTDDEFKFRKDRAWTVTRGAIAYVDPFVLTTGEGQAVVNNGKTMSVAADGIYDIYYNAFLKQVAVCEPDKTPNWKDAPGAYNGPVEGDSEWSLIGDLLDTNWDTDWVAAKDGDIYVVKNVWLNPGDQFKFRKDKDWTVNRGAVGNVAPFVLTTGEGQAVVNYGTNLSVAAYGIYDIYYNAAKEQMAVYEPDKAPNWKDVPITIDGDFSDWSTLEAGTFAKSVSDPYAPWGGVKEIRCYAKDDMVFYYIRFDEESLADAFEMEPNDMHLRLCINTDGEYESGDTRYFLEAYDFIIEGTFADGGAFVDFDGEFWQRISGSWTSLLSPENGLVEGKGAGAEYEIALRRDVFNEAANTSPVPMPMGYTFQTGIRFYYNGWSEFSNVPNSDVDAEMGNGWGYLMRVYFN